MSTVEWVLLLIVLLGVVGWLWYTAGDNNDLTDEDEFEIWARRTNLSLHKNASGTYYDTYTAIAYYAWKASRK